LPFIDQGDRCECVDSGTCEVLSDNDKAIICGNGLCEGTENRQLLYRWAEKRIINGQSILYPVSPEENEYYCEKDCAKQTISSTPRYSCSNGQCVTNPNGAFLTNNCNNMCVASRKYACNNSGVCVLTTGGPYTTSNCDNECIPSTMKLLEEIYYDKAKIQGRCAYTQEITGDFHYATLSEDKQFYPALKIKSPISYKSYLTLNTRNFPQDPVDKCCDFGWIKICLEGAFLRHSGFELISNIEDLKKYFTVSDISIFEGDFFDKNILVFPYYYL